MASWYYLPGDLIPFFRRLPQSSYQKLELEEYFLQRTPFGGIIEYLHEQLNNIANNSILEPLEWSLFAFTCIYKEVPRVALDYLDNYSNEMYQSPITLCWQFALVTKVFGLESNWPIDIEVLSNYSDQISLPEIDRLLSVMKSFISISGEIGNWKIQLQKFIDANLEFVLNNPNEIASIFISLNPAIQNNPKEFRELVEPLVILFDEMGQDWLTARMKHIVANLDYAEGRFESAAKMWKECLVSYENTGYNKKYGIYHNLALHHKNLEQYQKAEEFLAKASEGMSERSTDNLQMLIYQSMGRLDEAIVIAERMVDYTSRFVGPLRSLVELYLEKGVKFNVEELLEKAENICKDYPAGPNKIELQIIKAEIAKYNGNYHGAQNMYQEVISSSIDRFALNNLFNVFPKLVEVQFDLVKFKPDNTRYRDNLLETLQDVYLLVEEQEIPQGMVKVQLVRSRIFEFLGRQQEAIEACYNAAKLADQFGFENLQVRADQQLSEFRKGEETQDDDREGVFNKMRGMIRSLFSSGDQKSTYQKIDYTIYGVMTLTSYGTSIYSKYFSDKLSSEPNLISGLITAITSFMKEVTKGEGMLQSIQHQDMTIMLESISHGFLTVCIVSKETLELRHIVRSFSEELKEHTEDHIDDLENGNVTNQFISAVDRLVSNTFDK